MNNEFIKNLKCEKYKITAWNKNLIEIDLFKSFFIVHLKKIKNHPGEDTGWTLYHGPNNLIVKGGLFRGVEYLESIQYGNNLANEHNNFVNPFYIFQILNRAGRCFFMNYYKAEIDSLLADKINTVKNLQLKLELAIEESESAYKFFDNVVDPYQGD